MSADIRHPIQLDILETIRCSPSALRYTEIKPGNIDNDLYNYHLQHLVKQKLVSKSRGGYGLSANGKKYLAELQPYDIDSGLSHKFKIAALALVIDASDPKEIRALYQLRGREPFMGNCEIIGGGLRRGEAVLAAAKRRLFEEAGLTAEFCHVGTVRKIRLDKQGELYSDILYQVCIASVFTGLLDVKSKYGTHIWLPIKDAIVVEGKTSYGSKAIAKMLTKLSNHPSESPAFFYAEEII